jgi:hypothetical protein
MEWDLAIPKWPENWSLENAIKRGRIRQDAIPSDLAACQSHASIQAHRFGLARQARVSLDLAACQIPRLAHAYPCTVGLGLRSRAFRVPVKKTVGHVPKPHWRTRHIVPQVQACSRVRAEVPVKKVPVKKKS